MLKMQLKNPFSPGIRATAEVLEWGWGCWGAAEWYGC